MLNVPYHGQAPAKTSPIAVQADLEMLPACSVSEIRMVGKLKVYAVSTKGRLYDLSEVPALSEVGFFYELCQWVLYCDPGQQLSMMVPRLEAEVCSIMAKSSEVNVAFQKIGLDVFRATNAVEFQHFIESAYTHWGGVIWASKVPVE